MLYGILTALILLELSSRAILLIDRPSNGDGVMPSNDPELIFVPYIGQTAGDETGPVNQLGTRGPAPDLSKPNRVLVIGDSVAYGLGVPDTSSFPRVLEELLDPRSTTVINGAVPGYETWQEARRLETLAPKVNPTAVVIQFFGNDKWRTPAEMRTWMRRQRIPRDIVYGGDGGTFLFRASGLFRLISLHSRHQAPPTDAQDRPEEWATAWERMLAFATDHSQQTVVLLMPTRDSVVKGRARTAPEAERIAARLGVPTLDLAVPLREHGAEALYIDGDSVHLNAEGHRLVARLLRERLKGVSSALSSGLAE